MQRRRNDRLRGRQSTSSDSQQTVRRPTALVSVRLLTLAQENQLLTPRSHSRLYFPLFVKKRLIPEVCMCCIRMYVLQTLIIGLEHINQKRWAIPHCVLDSFIMSSSDKPGSNPFTVRAWLRCQDNRRSPDTLTLKARWRPFVLTQPTPPPQWWWHPTRQHLHL